MAVTETGQFRTPNWSHDSKYIYLIDLTRGFVIIRIGVKDGRVDRIVRLNGLTDPPDLWLGLAGDDSPILRLDKSSSEIYALDLAVP